MSIRKCNKLLPQQDYFSFVQLVSFRVVHSLWCFRHFPFQQASFSSLLHFVNVPYQTGSVNYDSICAIFSHNSNKMTNQNSREEN